MSGLQKVALKFSINMVTGIVGRHRAMLAALSRWKLYSYFKCRTNRSEANQATKVGFDQSMTKKFACP